MGQASETLFTELWGEQTLNSMKRLAKSVKRVFNSVTDYTPFTTGKKAAGYHGPAFSGIAAETVARGAGFASVQDATNTSIDIDFAQKSGGCFNIKVDEDQQTDVDLIKEYGDEMAEEVFDEYDEYILTELIGDVPAANKVDFDDAASNADVITLGDFKNADKVLNLAGAPQRGRAVFIDPIHYSQLLDIDEFISADKIKDADLKEGIVGRILKFDIIMTSLTPMVDIAGDIHATAGKNDSYPVIFIQKLAYGWGRQKELETMDANDPQNTAKQRALWSMHGGKDQETSYMFQVSDQTTADPV